MKKNNYLKVDFKLEMSAKDFWRLCRKAVKLPRILSVIVNMLTMYGVAKVVLLLSLNGQLPHRGGENWSLVNVSLAEETRARSN